MHTPSKTLKIIYLCEILFNMGGRGIKFGIKLPNNLILLTLLQNLKYIVYICSKLLKSIKLAVSLVI